MSSVPVSTRVLCKAPGLCPGPGTGSRHGGQGRKVSPGLQGLQGREEEGRECRRPEDSQAEPRESDPDTRFYFKNLDRHQSLTDDKQSKTPTRSSRHLKQKAQDTLIFLLEKQPKISETFTVALS